MRKVFLLAVFAIAAFAVQAQEKVTLRLNLKKGDSYSQVMNMNTTMTINVAGQEMMNMEMPMEIGLKFKVKNVYTDSVELEASISKMKMTVNMQGEQMTLDTEDNTKNSPKEFKIFNKIISKPFTIVYDGRCNIVRISGFEKTYDDMISDLPASERAKAKEELAGIISENTLKDNFEQSSIIFPEEPIYEGYSWTTSFSKEVNGMNFSYHTLNQVKSIDKKSGKVLIASTSKIDLEMSEIQGFKVSMGKGTKFDINYVIDLKTGIFDLAEGEMVLPIDMSGEDENGEKATMSMQVKMAIGVKTK